MIFVSFCEKVFYLLDGVVVTNSGINYLGINSMISVHSLDTLCEHMFEGNPPADGEGIASIRMRSLPGGFA